ncbi:MAG: outer membrane beta-barrel protein [Ignavibacteriales bacterium]|nr:outer membrane beta-barrel protein [Ignavibacteriales bacterium]
MKKKSILICMLLFLIAGTVFSQSIFFNARGGLALPTGKLSDSINLGVGGTLACGYNFDENVAMTLTSGYLHFPGKEMVSAKTSSIMKYDVVPILIGAKYTGLFYEQLSAYLKMDIGVYMMKGTQTVTILESGIVGTAENTETKFTLVPSIGGEYQINENLNIDLNISYSHLATIDHATTWIGIFTGLKYTL